MGSAPLRKYIGLNGKLGFLFGHSLFFPPSVRLWQWPAAKPIHRLYQSRNLLLFAPQDIFRCRITVHQTNTKHAPDQRASIHCFGCRFEKSTPGDLNYLYREFYELYRSKDLRHIFNDLNSPGVVAVSLEAECLSLSSTFFASSCIEHSCCSRIFAPGPSL
jgi:hypothetical protein